MIIQNGAFMKIAKALGYILAAEIMSLFIGFTLAGSSSVLIRIISAVCTTGILICLTADFALNTAREDLRLKRINNTKTNTFSAFAIGGIMSAPALISWCVLKLSHITGAFDFYRWHKILNAYFIQIYNFININAETSSLSASQINLMLPLAFIPFASFTITYFLVLKSAVNEA